MDPKFLFDFKNLETDTVRLFPMTSDAFFGKHADTAYGVAAEDPATEKAPGNRGAERRAVALFRCRPDRSTAGAVLQRRATRIPGRLFTPDAETFCCLDGLRRGRQKQPVNEE